MIKVHGIGKPLDDIAPRGPNLKLRKRYRQMIENELEFDRLTGAGTGNDDSIEEDTYTPNGNIEEVSVIIVYKFCSYGQWS